MQIPVVSVGAGVFPGLRAHLCFLSAKDGNRTARSPGAVARWMEAARMARPDLEVMGRAENQR